MPRRALRTEQKRQNNAQRQRDFRARQNPNNEPLPAQATVPLETSRKLQEAEHRYALRSRSGTSSVPPQSPRAKYGMPIGSIPDDILDAPSQLEDLLSDLHISIQEDPVQDGSQPTIPTVARDHQEETQPNSIDSTPHSDIHGPRPDEHLAPPLHTTVEDVIEASSEPDEPIRRPNISPQAIDDWVPIFSSPSVTTSTSEEPHQHQRRSPRPPTSDGEPTHSTHNDDDESLEGYTAYEVCRHLASLLSPTRSIDMSGYRSPQ